MTKVLNILYIPFWIYSNRVYDTHAMVVVAFTFHSGYILICTPDLYNNVNFLYIPFWIYSNKIPLNVRGKTIKLYIPFWIYSNSKPGINHNE